MANIVGVLNLDDLSDYSLFEQATDDLNTMQTIREQWIMAEEARPNPDKALIAQWNAEWSQFHDENESLGVDERARNIAIIKKCAPQIQAWCKGDEKAVRAKASDGGFEREYLKYEALVLTKSEAREDPIAIIIAGQSGSRKLIRTKIAQSELKNFGGYLLVDTDVLCEKHPDYVDLMQENDKEAANRTHEVAFAWARRLMEKGIGERRNLIIDLTSMDAEVRQQTEQLREAGYYVEIHVMATSDMISELGIYCRYEEQKAKRGVGRFTTKDVHDKVYQDIPAIVERVEKEKLVDRVLIFQGNDLL